MNSQQHRNQLLLNDAGPSSHKLRLDISKFLRFFGLGYNYLGSYVFPVRSFYGQTNSKLRGVNEIN